MHRVFLYPPGFRGQALTGVKMGKWNAQGFESRSKSMPQTLFLRSFLRKNREKFEKTKKLKTFTYCVLANSQNCKIKKNSH